MSTVRYSDEELWAMPKAELDQLKLTLTMNEFSLWSIDRLGELIKRSTEMDNWMEPVANHLRTYRAKAQRFYLEKIVKEN